MRFETGLNQNREYLYMDFYESRTADYTLLQTTPVGETWDDWFPPDYPDPGTYTVTFVSKLPGSAEGALATVSGPDPFGGPKNLELHMVRVGLDWYLERLVLDGATIVD